MEVEYEIKKNLLTSSTCRNKKDKDPNFKFLFFHVSSASVAWALESTVRYFVAELMEGGTKRMTTA